ncbi:poly-gamma-glutamate synthase PgsB [Streptomyces sp. NPDC056202]|uniref:poly-gamma-glutamate synthase PgsB n=1 Tax=Streptomyces sp. NPDC056202 TaxID=3345745 RepID=UPI0035DE9EA7
MLYLYLVLLVSSAVLLVAGVVEQRRHLASLESIPTRVLVNGIRGKSSITRLCAGALRGGGLVTVAKTTGTAARFIHPDATEEPVYRKFGIANVVEQVGIVRRAAAYRPDALVIECMAVMPALQEVNQTKLIRSTIGVLCNVREDHLEEMGPTLDDVARSLCRSMPYDGICVTAERDRLDILQEEADRRRCTLVPVDPETVSDEELRGFSWFTFKENVAIALKVAELLGVERQTALRGMYDAPPDPGVLSVERYEAPGGKRLRFANVFAANDPESTLMNIHQLLDLGAVQRPLNVLINCRPDRVERNGQMGQIVPELAPDQVFLIGHPTKSAADAIPAEWRDRVVDLGGDRRDAREVLDRIVEHLGPRSSLVAIGNIHGQGELLLEELAELPPDEGPEELPDEGPEAVSVCVTGGDTQVLPVYEAGASAYRDPVQDAYQAPYPYPYQDSNAYPYQDPYPYEDPYPHPPHDYRHPTGEPR